MTKQYHIPVMLHDALDGLLLKPGGIYVDLTFGGGGHSISLLKRLKEGALWAFDQDPDALLEAKKIEDPRFHFIRANFRFFAPILRSLGVDRVDGILVDLGTSSHQLNQANRGFAARLDGTLDMRMHATGELTASKVVNSFSQQQLVKIFQDYSDITNSKRLAREIVQARQIQPIHTTAQLREAIHSCLPPYRDYQYLAKVFQALRIAVNDEIQALEAMMADVPNMLNPRGRWVVISYHSGEDRVVKRFIQYGNKTGKPKKDFYGNLIRPLEPVYRKVLKPTQEEIKLNNSARSARMRIATPTIF
ncbi:MAG: 16S rRNA (cytosine(1402)-N(4))-methyltransferase RsmH [Bacteroidota bacterium]